MSLRPNSHIHVAGHLQAIFHNTWGRKFIKDFMHWTKQTIIIAEDCCTWELGLTVSAHCESLTHNYKINILMQKLEKFAWARDSFKVNSVPLEYYESGLAYYFLQCLHYGIPIIKLNNQQPWFWKFPQHLQC